MASESCAPLRVLLVEDDARTTRRLARMLREDGYEVDIATDALTATERLGQRPAPDALVTELHVSHTGGARLVRLARATNPGVAIVVVTRHPNLTASLERELDPPAMVITKPLVYEELQALLAGLVPSRSDTMTRAHSS